MLAQSSPRAKSSAPFFHRLILALIFISSTPVAAEYVDKFTACKAKVQAVRNGTASIRNITNATIMNYDYIYTGRAKELDSSYPRDQYLLLTYKGTRFFT